MRWVAELDFLRRLMIGLVAACGLVLAACLSALPSCSCAAMAETYAEAAIRFGFVGFMALIPAALAQAPITGSSVFRVFSVTLMSIVAVTLFVPSVFGGTRNLKTATLYCYVGTAKQLSERSHDEIPLFFGVPGVITLETVFDHGRRNPDN